MDTIPSWLASYGLNDTEIKVYLSVLQYPDTKVTDIQRRTGLVRTTIYYALGKLRADGLVSEHFQNNVKSYRASDLANLERNIEAEISAQKQKLDALATLAPLFEILQSGSKEKESYVSRYEGMGPVKQSIEDAFRCKSKEWIVIASRDNFLYHTSAQYKKYYLEERNRRGIVAKTLWEPVDDFNEELYVDTYHRNPRHLPAKFRGAFKSLVILYDDTTLIVDPYVQKTAHAITNYESTNLLKLMFETIFESLESSQK